MREVKYLYKGRLAECYEYSYCRLRSKVGTRNHTT